jgi:hypothetical protein
MDDGFEVVMALLSIIFGILIGAFCGASLMKRSFEEGKFCPECGSHYSEADLYCTNDGTELLIISGYQ